MGQLTSAYLNGNTDQAANLIKQGAQAGPKGASAVATATATASKLVRPHTEVHACKGDGMC